MSDMLLVPLVVTTRTTLLGRMFRENCAVDSLREAARENPRFVSPWFPMALSAAPAHQRFME
jgi:hypothetical protein